MRATLFLATTRPAEARAFFADVLGFALVREDPFALVFETGTALLRVTPVERFTPHAHTVAGWEVDDLAATLARLVPAGLVPIRYPSLGAAQAADGSWASPTGARVVWFHDPDGNVLSLTEPARA